MSETNNSPRIIALIVIIIAIGLLAVLFLRGEDDSAKPPTLDLSTATLQGRIEDSEMYFELDPTDYRDPSWTKSLDKKDYPKYQKTVFAEPSINYFYFNEDKTVDQIIKSIIPVSELGVFFIVYNSSEGQCIEKGKTGFHTYKSGPFSDSIEIKNKSVTIKAYCPFIIKSTERTQMWGVNNQTNYVTSAVFEDIISEYDAEGWALLPMPKTLDLGDIKEASSNTLQKIAPLKVKDSFDGKTDFYYEDMGDIKKVKIVKDNYLAWVYFGEPTVCPDGFYSAGVACYECGNYRECNYGQASKGEVAVWHLDKSSGGKTLDSLNYNDGVTENTAFTTGIKGRALKFNGKDSSVEIESSRDFKFTEEMSMEAWIKPFDKKDGQIVKIGNHGIYKDDIKGWKATFRVGKKNYFVDWGKKTNPKLNDWHHVVATYDGESLKIYVNGEEMDSLNRKGKLATSDVPVYIGASEKGEHFNGLIDEVTIYKKALTRSEIKELYDRYTE